MYRVDGKLVAIGVIDILPGCVSSVYFIYAEGWGPWSLGKVSASSILKINSGYRYFIKISAIREVTLAKELHDAGAEIVDSLYMGMCTIYQSNNSNLTQSHPGFYIHSCPKMKYKGEYEPSYLLDPVSL